MSSAAVYRLIFAMILIALGAGYVSLIAHYFGAVKMADINMQEFGFIMFLSFPGFACMIGGAILRHIRD